MANQQIAAIEHENRAFWQRMLRERFDRDVTLEVDWGSFESDSAEAGWPLYPLNIQQAGVERLLYAITGLMDKDEKFRAAASYCIDSIHITSAKNIKSIQLLYHKGRITYRCFAGDWNGYFGIDQMQEYLDDRVPRKSMVRRKMEGWMRGLLTVRRREEADHWESASSPAAEPERIEQEPEPIVHEQPVRADPAKHTIQPYDATLRSHLESLYNAFLQALKDTDLERLLDLVCTTKTDEETLRSEMEKDGFASFSQWFLTTYPTLEQANFVALKTKEEDLAGYYMEWLPPYTQEYLSLTLVRYLKIGGEWKIVFRLTEMTSAPFRVLKDEEPLVKTLEVLATNPLMNLEYPELSDDMETPVRAPKLSKRKTRLKEELEQVLATVRGSLEQRDAKAFLAAVAVSEKHARTLRKKFKKLSKEILDNTPEPSKAIFVKLETKGNDIVGYYFVAPYPTNPAFKFVYLKPFVRRHGQWKMVFSLETDLGVSMNVTKSGGDLITRAHAVIAEIPLLHLDDAMTYAFEDIIAAAE